MKHSRRFFLRQAAATAAGLALLPSLSSAAHGKTVSRSPVVPGLLFGREDLDRLRATVRHPRFQEYWKGMVEADLAADRKFIASELKFNNHVRHLLRVRQMLERSSFVAVLTGDRDHRALALEAIETIMKFPKWDYFLEGGELVIGLQRAPETTIAMVLAREWLDDVLTPAMAAEMENQIAEKGAPACYRTLYGLKYPERVRGWGFDPTTDFTMAVDMKRWPLILNSTNLKVIPIAGLTLAACLLAGRHPQAAKWADMARQSARAFGMMFGSDGCYDEGVGYWGYTASHLTLCVDALSRRLGIDERALMNFAGTSRYGLQMTMPTVARANDCVNFGDAWSMGDISVAAWTARTFRDPLAQYVALHAGVVSSHYAVIWFDPTQPEKEPDASLHDVRFVNDLVISRTGFDATSTVLALRSGGPANHEHADRNSIVLSAHGERLLHDPFKAAYSYRDPHWILRLTSGHTALLIDGKGHQYHDGHEGTNASFAEARVVSYRTGTDTMVVTSDATDAYALVHADVLRVLRTVIFLKPDIVMIVDRVRLRSGPRPVQVRFQVDNSDGHGTASILGGAFDIVRPLATLHGTVSGTQGVALRTATIPVPAEHGIHPFVEAESAPALEHVLLTVCTTAPTGRQHGTLALARSGMVWTSEGTHGGRKVRVTVDLTHDEPEVRL